MLGIVSFIRICFMYVHNLIAILLTFLIVNYVVSKQKYEKTNVGL